MMNVTLAIWMNDLQTVTTSIRQAIDTNLKVNKTKKNQFSISNNLFNLQLANTQGIHLKLEGHKIHELKVIRQEPLRGFLCDCFRVLELIYKSQYYSIHTLMMQGSLDLP